MSGFVVTKVDA